MTGDEMEAGRGESYEVFFLSCPCAQIQIRLRLGKTGAMGKTWG